MDSKSFKTSYLNKESIVKNWFVANADGKTLGRFSSEVAELEIDLLAMEIFNLRTVSAAAEGKAPGMESSLLKIKGTRVRQKTTELLRKALGPQALPYLPEQFDEGWNEMPIGPEYAGPIAKQYFNMRKISIYGGSNEIQKNIVAKASFGL